MVNGYERYCNVSEDIHFPEGFAATANKAQLEEQQLLVERLIAAAKAVGHPHEHPLAPIALSVYTQQLRSTLPERLNQYESALNRLQQAGKNLSNIWGINLPDCFEQWSSLDRMAQEVASWFSVPHAWSGYEDILRAMGQIAEMCRHYQLTGQLKTTLGGLWNEAFLQQDGASLLTQWSQVSAKWFLPKFFGQKRFVKLLAQVSSTHPDKSGLVGELERLTQYQSELSAADTLFSTYGEDLGMVGHSSYRVDVGVVNPEHPESYLVGVLLDGPAHGTSKTVRDRELAQPEVLTGLGWELHRIWTMDWWDNRSKELKRLLAHIEQVAANSKMQTPETMQEMAPMPDVVKSKAKIASEYHDQEVESVQQIPDYRIATLPVGVFPPDDYLMPERVPILKQLLEQVLAVEAPISESMMMKRVLQSLGIARAGSRIQAHTADHLRRMQVRTTVQNDQRFYWGDGQDPTTYQGLRVSNAGIRDAKDVPVQEAANAVYQVLNEQVGLPREDLIRETAKLLGYARSGSVVVTMAEGEIQFALSTGKISEGQGGYLHFSH